MIPHGLTTKGLKGMKSFDFVLFESTKRKQDLLGCFNRMITQVSRAFQLYLKKELHQFLLVVRGDLQMLGVDRSLMSRLPHSIRIEIRVIMYALVSRAFELRFRRKLHQFSLVVRIKCRDSD